MRGTAEKGFRESDAIPIKFRLKLRFAPRKDADETKRGVGGDYMSGLLLCPSVFN
jgi:hypothetical protein